MLRTMQQPLIYPYNAELSLKYRRKMSANRGGYQVGGSEAQRRANSVLDLNQCHSYLHRLILADLGPVGEGGRRVRQDFEL